MLGSEPSAIRVLVTGASTGIGAAVAARLTADGAHVAGVSRSGTAPSGVTPIAADLTSPTDLDGIVERVVAELGGLDVVVNNAGAGDWRPVGDVDRDFFDAMIGLNLWAPFRLCQLAHPHLAAADHGLVVNIGSVDAVRPSAGGAVYGATKAALGAMTVALAKEWMHDDIRVVQIDPGLVETPLAADAVASLGDDRVNLVGRPGRPAEIAGLVSYLASGEGHFVNATQFRVDGGALALGPFDLR